MQPDDPHDPFSGYRPDMDQHQTHEYEDNWPSWWIPVVLFLGTIGWISALIWVLVK